MRQRAEWELGVAECFIDVHCSCQERIWRHAFYNEPPFVTSGEHTVLLMEASPNSEAITLNPLNPASEALNPTPYTLHPTPYTLHPTPYTLNPKPQARNPKANVEASRTRIHVDRGPIACRVWGSGAGDSGLGFRFRDLVFRVISTLGCAGPHEYFQAARCELLEVNLEENHELFYFDHCCHVP